MAKKKRTGGGAGRTLPLSQRMQQERQAAIAANREDAAQTALKIACVALNDTEGLGRKRICRFAQRLMLLVKEYYASPEEGEYHLNKRLEQMGFVIGDQGQLLVVAEEVEDK